MRSLSLWLGSAPTYGAFGLEKDWGEILALSVKPRHILNEGAAVGSPFEDTHADFRMRNHKIPKYSIGGSNFFPFTLWERGDGNWASVFQRLIIRPSAERYIRIINVGGSGKVLVAKDVTLQVEYQYHRYHRSEGSDFYRTVTRSKWHNVRIGVSIVLQ
jgi:hypothetical protein